MTIHYVLKQEPCTCVETKGPVGCPYCNYTTYRTSLVSMTDALAELGIVLDDNEARRYRIAQIPRMVCPNCGLTKVKMVGDNYVCAECGHLMHTPGRSPMVEKTCPECKGTALYSYLHGTINCAHCGFQLSRGFPGGTPALLTPQLPRQSGAGVGHKPSGGAQVDASPRLQGCPACGFMSFTVVRPPPTRIAFNTDGKLRWPESLGGFKCRNCGQHIPELPIPAK